MVQMSFDGPPLKIIRTAEKMLALYKPISDGLEYETTI